MDTLSEEQRSWNMSRIRSKDTKPERTVRSLLHSMGFRFRLHVASLPGTPDIVLPRYKTVIFVHGCFWHHHPGCKYAYTPKSRVEFWMKKFEQNISAHERATGELTALGWHVLVIWECELSDLGSLRQKISALLRGSPDQLPSS